MKKPLRLLLLLTFLSASTFGQSEDDLIGTWRLDKAYTLKNNAFEVFNAEKHPYDTIHFDKDNSFYIRCHQYETKAHPIKEHWIIKGQWGFKKNSLYFTHRIRTDKDEKLKDLKYRIILKDNALYINYGKKTDPEKIYVKYYKL
jgi:hypothetical protein